MPGRTASHCGDTASLGAALTLIPAGAAQDAAKLATLTGDLLEAYVMKLELDVQVTGYPSGRLTLVAH